MKTLWIKGIKDKDLIDEIKGNFIASLLTRKRLCKILEDKLNTVDKLAMDAEGYNKPGWAYSMADIQGYKRAITEIISIISENSSNKT